MISVKLWENYSSWLKKNHHFFFILFIYLLANTHSPLNIETNKYICCSEYGADYSKQVTLNPSQTYIATALRPLRDWQFSPIAEVATRSPIGPGEVAEKSATDRGPRCDQISRSQVFVLAQKPGCDWFGRRQVPAKSPTSPRSVADWSDNNYCTNVPWKNAIIHFQVDLTFLSWSSTRGKCLRY